MADEVQRVFAALDAIGASHKTVDHEACCTVEEEAAVTHKLPGKHTKNFARQIILRTLLLLLQVTLIGC